MPKRPNTDGHVIITPVRVALDERRPQTGFGGRQRRPARDANASRWTSETDDETRGEGNGCCGGVRRFEKAIRKQAINKKKKRRVTSWNGDDAFQKPTVARRAY